MSYHIKNAVLIDDDDATNFLHQRLIRKIYTSAQIKIFNNGNVAFEYVLAHQHDIDLILLDVNMPTLSGWNFLDHLPLNGMNNLPIFLASTFFGKQDATKSYHHLNVHLLKKPISIQKLEEGLVKAQNAITAI